MVTTKSNPRKELSIVTGGFIFLALIYWIFRSTVIAYGDALGFYMDASKGFTFRTSVLDHF